MRMKSDLYFVFQLQISKAIIIKIKIYIMPRPVKGKRGSKIQTNIASQSKRKYEERKYSRNGTLRKNQNDKK